VSTRSFCLTKRIVWIFHELDRTYKKVSDVVHELQDALVEDPVFDLSGVCVADEVYAVTRLVRSCSPDGS